LFIRVLAGHRVRKFAVANCSSMMFRLAAHNGPGVEEGELAAVASGSVKRERLPGVVKVDSEAFSNSARTAAQPVAFVNHHLDLFESIKRAYRQSLAS